MVMRVQHKKCIILLSMSIIQLGDKCMDKFRFHRSCSSEKIKKHENSYTHKNACIEHSMLGRVDISTQLDNAYRHSVRKHNEQVDNQYIVSRLINCVKHNESEGSENPGIFWGLVNFVSFY